jgi:hypothetical protein
MPIVILLISIYLAPGLLFGLWFVWRGVQRIDPAAAGSPIGFRLCILPGCIALWPVMLVMWLRVREERET